MSNSDYQAGVALGILIGGALVLGALLLMGRWP
jgi:hypothetical protein